MVSHQSNPQAFSLVELIVAVAITGILLVGVSAFFAQHLNQLGNLEEQTEASRAHFLFQEVLRKKMMRGEEVLLMDNQATLKNKKGSPTPFTWLGRQADYLGLKDFFLLHGMEAGKTGADFPELAFPTGIAKVNNSYYVASWSENAIYRCNPGCTVLVEGLSGPLGLASNGSALFVAQVKNGTVLKIELNNLVQTVISDEFEQPTGLAYYQNPEGKAYLFVADSQAKAVKRLDLQTNKSEWVVGLGTNASCQKSALLCALDFPTALAVHGQSLYLADAGQGRILKVSEPDVVAGIPSELKLEFEIDPSLALDKFELTGAFEGEHFSEESNLMGNLTNYTIDGALKTFQNPIFQVAEEFDLCQLSHNLFTQAPLTNAGFQAEDEFQMAGVTYKILQFLPLKNCQSSEEEDAPQVWKLETSTDLKPTGTGGQFAYGKNPGAVELVLEEASFQSSGFQPITIETYEMNNNSPVETKTLLRRIGNGTLGSLEDPIEVWMEGLHYPSGLSVQAGKLWMVEGQGTSLKQFDLETKELISSEPLPLLTTEDFAPFDLTSAFPIQNFSLTMPWNHLLELSFEADLKEGTPQTYTLNKAMSQP